MADTGHKAIPQTLTCFSGVVYFLLKACKRLARRGNMAVLAFLFAYLPGATPAMAQKVYPVEANLQITPPFSLYLGDYTTGDERLKVNLFLKDLTKSNYPVRLKLKIEGFGITIVSKNNFYTPPIYLNGGQLHVVSGPELQDYFNPQNLAFQGIDLKAFNRNGAKLPEGVYRISIEVEDYSRRQLVSNAGAAVLSAFMSYPPVINQPFPDAKVTALFPQNLVFQWMPRHTASFNAAFNIVYRLRLVEVNPAGRDPNDAMRSSRPLFETITHLTQYVYGPSEPQLVPGNTYALQVQALDADGKDAFVNQGYSEVVRFVYGERCAVPISVLAQLQDKNSLQLSWAQLPMQQRYSVRYREANNSKAEWFEQEVYTAQFNARGLRPGATYEYQVKAACDYGYGDYTVAQQFTMPNEAVTTGDIVCGEPSSVKAPTNKELLPLLQPGMVFFAGSFPVHVTEVQGGGERVTGRGTIGVPYLNKLNFAVEFKDIQINTDLKLINGRVSIAKQSLEQAQEGVKQAITVTPDENGVVEAIASNGLPTIIDVAVAVPATLPTYHAKDKTVTFTGLTNNGSSKEITIKLKDGQPPLLFQDKNGETYEVAQDGKVTHKGKFSTAEMLAGGGLTNKLLSTDKATVTFRAAADQKYGLDLFQQSLASNSRYKEAYQQVPTSQGSRYVSWKSVEAGAGDVVVAEITNASVDLDKIEFRNGKGDKLSSERKGKQFTISLVGAHEGNDREIYAFYPTDKEGKEGLNLGKLNIASFKKITKKVVIVPVNGAGEHLTAAAIRTHLNSIYKQAVVDWDVTTADNFVAYTDGEDGWDLDRNGLDVGNSSMASAYTAEQKKLAGLYAKKHTLQDKTYYLFLVNRFSDPGQKGYMVRGGQVGFVKVPSHDAETDAAVLHTMAHELGHGAFNLQHTWDVYGADTQGRTDNLMDYGLGASLSYAQWKYMRNPDIIFRPFEGDDEGASHDIKIEELLAWIRNNIGKKVGFRRDAFFTSSFKSKAWVDIPLYFEYKGKKYTTYAEVYDDGEVDFQVTDTRTFKAFGVNIDHSSRFHTGFKLSVKYAGSNDRAFTIWTYSYEDYEALLGKLGITLGESAKANIINGYESALKVAGNDCNKLDVIYENMPDFVSSILSDEVLWKHLQSLANCNMLKTSGLGNVSGTDEEKSALNILKAFKDKEGLYRKLFQNKEVIAELFEGFDGDNALHYVNILDELVQKYGQVEGNIKEFVFLGEAGEAYKDIPQYYRRPYILGGSTGFSSQNDIIIDCFIGRANLSPLGWGTAQRLKDISAFTVHPLAPIRVYFEEEDQATIRPAIYAYLLGARLTRDQQFSAINDFTNILGLSAAARILTTKGAGLILKTLAVIEISKLSVDQAMNRKAIQEELQKSTEGKWFLQNWPYISIATDITVFGADMLSSLAINGPKVSKVFREAGQNDAAKHIDEITRQASEASGVVAKVGEDLIASLKGSIKLTFDDLISSGLKYEVKANSILLKNLSNETVAIINNGKLTPTKWEWHIRVPASSQTSTSEGYILIKDGTDYKFDLGFKEGRKLEAKEVNDYLVNGQGKDLDGQPYWAGTVVDEIVLSKGDVIYFVEDFNGGLANPGQYASKDVITTIKELREKLAVKEAWKKASNLPTLRSYRVKSELKTRSGIIGRQNDNGKELPGGGHQYEVIDYLGPNWRTYLEEIGPIGGVKLK